MEQEIYSHKENRKEKLAIKLIRMKQLIIRFRKQKIESMKELFLYLKINMRKMNTNSKLWVQISKESIQNMSNTNCNNNDKH